MITKILQGTSSVVAQTVLDVNFLVHMHKEWCKLVCCTVIEFWTQQFTFGPPCMVVSVAGLEKKPSFLRKFLGFLDFGVQTRTDTKFQPMKNILHTILYHTIFYKL